jgi:ketosteroid isomerase-like protein
VKVGSLTQRISVCVAGILLAWGAGPSAWGHQRGSRRPRQDTSANAQIEALENAWTAALNEDDVNAIGDILADDFTRPDPQSGTFIDKQELLRYYRSSKFREAHLRISIADMTVNVYGDTAIARGHVHAHDSGGHVVSTLLFTDVLVRRNAKWWAVSAQENSVTR